MSLHRTQQLLLPVQPWFIAITLFVALLLNLLPFGRTPWVPDLLLLVLAFWVLHQPLFVQAGKSRIARNHLPMRRPGGKDHPIHRQMRQIAAAARADRFRP